MFDGEVAEWFKAHAWKVCVLSKVPWVRIPLSPPNCSIKSSFYYKKLEIEKNKKKYQIYIDLID